MKSMQKKPNLHKPMHKSKDEKKVNLMKWGDKMDYFEFKSPNDLQKGMAWFQSELAQSRQEWQEEQNRVINSGRKLFQEGQKAERERIIGEVEKLDEIATINAPIHFEDPDFFKSGISYDVSDFRLVRKADILHILKGEK